MTKEDYDTLMVLIPKLIGITKRTFIGWIYIPLGSGQEIPAGALIKLAHLFECSTKDLFEDKTEFEKFQIELKKSFSKTEPYATHH